MSMQAFMVTLLRGFFSLLVIAGLLFISAGTLNYAAAWLFLGVLGLTALSFSFWLYKTNPKQFNNRLNPTEPDNRQRRVLALIAATLGASLIVSGLDKRFAWSHIPDWRYLFAAIQLCISVSIYVNVFTNNPFLSNTVKIHEKHKVVKTGLYGIVRHPMYLASCMACASGFTILGSWLCVPLYGVFIKLILTRISFEEKELLLALPEYANYVAEVQHKLIPIYINRKKSNYSWSNLHH